ncbi:SLC13 family permease [Bacillus horti]|uniref:Sodium-dependent dicarboxylate transporter SdcS n=1 Tax=Caldalkalibacillus horti TaxID=77523 RepID=A0ABT9W5A0_9BACI|nr:DASS family sodium-coupled anion symporter [Bacillus horti]MDQ0168419.1 anion transporter [Bacillus horti]
MWNKKAMWIVLIAIAFLYILFVLDDQVNWEIRAALAVTFLGISLWIIELVPFGLTSVLILILYLMFQVSTVETVLSGYASGAVFLILGGMMLANGVNQTFLGQRMVYYILKITGNKATSLLLGIIMVPQILAIFIPASAVRAALILPIVLSLISLLKLEDQVNFKKQMMLALAYGGNVSGVGLLPAAIGNILVVELVYLYTDHVISYFDWFLYAFPIWLLSIPVTWYVVKKAYPLDGVKLGNVKGEIDGQLQKLGKLTMAEKKCIGILLLTVTLWTTQSVHGLHPAFPTLLAAILIGLPKLGFASWEELTKVNINTLLLIGTTMSIGIVLIDTGAIKYLTSILFTEWMLQLLAQPILSILILVLIVQFVHLGVSIVNTVVVALVPVTISLAMELAMDPVLFAMVTGIASIFGFILVVESIPNVIAYGTGLIGQRDFIKPGIKLTFLTTIIIVLVSFTWWKWIGLS